MLSMVSGKQRGCSDLQIARVMWRVRVEKIQLKVTHNVSVANAVKCRQLLLLYPFAPQRTQWSEHSKHRQEQESDCEEVHGDGYRSASKGPCVAIECVNDWVYIICMKLFGQSICALLIVLWLAVVSPSEEDRVTS